MPNCTRTFLIIILTLVGYVGWSQTFNYDVNKATKALTENALDKSHTCCAWFVMRAMQAGGCPIGILPAWAYSEVLPHYGFTEVPTAHYTPIKGDIVVIENSKEHFWGHIAMYNGTQWISDFKQKNMNPYRKSYPYKIFRKSE